MHTYFPAGDGAIYLLVIIITRYFAAADRAIAAHQGPFFALAIIFEVADAVLAAVAPGHYFQCSALLHAISRSRISQTGARRSRSFGSRSRGVAVVAFSVVGTTFTDGTDGIEFSAVFDAQALNAKSETNNARIKSFFILFELYFIIF